MRFVVRLRLEFTQGRSRPFFAVGDISPAVHGGENRKLTPPAAFQGHLRHGNALKGVIDPGRVLPSQP